MTVRSIGGRAVSVNTKHEYISAFFSLTTLHSVQQIYQRCTLAIPHILPGCAHQSKLLFVRTEYDFLSSFHAGENSRSPFLNISDSRNFCTLPDSVIGNSATEYQYFGTL